MSIAFQQQCPKIGGTTAWRAAHRKQTQLQGWCPQQSHTDSVRNLKPQQESINVRRAKTNPFSPTRAPLRAVRQLPPGLQPRALGNHSGKINRVRHLIGASLPRQSGAFQWRIVYFHPVYHEGALRKAGGISRSGGTCVMGVLLNTTYATS